MRWTDRLALVGGVALLASPWLHWVRRGPGNTLTGREMIDAIVGLDDLPGLSAARLALAWYLVPASGALVWIAVGLGRARRSAAVASTICGLIVVGMFAWIVGLGALGPGAWLALGGALATLGALRRT